MRHKNSDFQTSWNLRFSALEPEPSLVFWLDTSVDVLCLVMFAEWQDQILLAKPNLLLERKSLNVKSVVYHNKSQKNEKCFNIWYQQKTIP
jgi:hypothetical protein